MLMDGSAGDLAMMAALCICLNDLVHSDEATSSVIVADVNA
jgi:hypothetical protein